MKTIQFRNILNNEVMAKINCLEDGTFEVITANTTKIYKSLAWAKKFMFSYGYEEVETAEAGNEYVASCEDAEGNIVILEKVYSTKKDFKEDIKDNGYKLRYDYIFTKEEYEKFINEDTDFMLWFEDRLNRRKKRNYKIPTKGQKKAEGMKVITKEEYDRMSSDYKGVYMDYQGQFPHLKGRRTILDYDKEHGTVLLIEGESLYILE